MRIWRIDATCPGDDVPCGGEIVEDVVGMLTFFAPTLGSCELVRHRLADAGWEFDCYQEEVGALPADVRRRIFECPWPVLPTWKLLVLAESPKAAARDRLNEILTTQRGLPRLAPSPPQPKEVTTDECDNDA